MRRGYGWHHGLRRMNRGRWWTGRWGFHHRPCCCLLFTLPLLVVPFLAVVVLLIHFSGVPI